MLHLPRRQPRCQRRPRLPTESEWYLFIEDWVLIIRIKWCGLWSPRDRFRWNSFLFVPDIRKFITETRYLIYGFRIYICRFRQIQSLSKGKVSIIHTHVSIQVPIVDLMVRSWHPVFVISHLLWIHLQTTVSRELVLVASWHLSDWITKHVPSYLAGGFGSEWNSAYASLLCLMKFL